MSFSLDGVWSGATASDRLLGSYSGSLIPGPFSSGGNALFVVFTSDEYVEGTGFSAHWSTFQLAAGITPCSSNRHVELKGPSGDFGCDGYSFSITTSFHVTGNVGERIVLSFQTFNTELDYDVVKVYDGECSSESLRSSLSHRA